MRHRPALAFLTLLFSSSVSLPASGSYPPNPPRLGVSALSKIDARAYNLGKTLFTDRLTLPEAAIPGANPADNLAKLNSVQERLPERLRGEIDLPALAHRLDSSQVDALLYYVGIRFRISVADTQSPAS